jgi:hypothetical protein
LKKGNQIFAQDSLRTMFQFKKTEIEQANHLRLIVKGLDQQGNNAGQSSPRVLIGIEPTSQFLADPQPPEARLGCRPEEVFFSRKMAENGDFADSSQSGNLVRTAAREALSREQLYGGFHNAVFCGIFAAIFFYRHFIQQWL